MVKRRRLLDLREVLVRLPKINSAAYYDTSAAQEFFTEYERFVQWLRDQEPQKILRNRRVGS